jgi:hypothetical protein
MSKIEKYRAYDKFDGALYNNNRFVHTSWGLSDKMQHFHSSNTYVYSSRKSYDMQLSFGIQKKVHKISGHAITVDSVEIGKLDNT